VHVVRYGEDRGNRLRLEEISGKRRCVEPVGNIGKISLAAWMRKALRNMVRMDACETEGQEISVQKVSKPRRKWQTSANYIKSAEVTHKN
jgi:hypothetical protein